MRIFTIVFLFFGIFASAQTIDDFVFDVDVTNSYRFRITSNASITIDWGDGMTNSYGSPNDIQVTHTYPTAGMYTVVVTGPLETINFYQNNSVIITQWGNSQFQTMEEAFKYCQNLSINATDVPDLSNVTNMSEMFSYAINFNSDISNWDVSNVTDMENMFKGAYAFNSPLSSWNVSNVTEFNGMFHLARSFNQPLNTWDITNARILTSMFSGAQDFNQTLKSWDVSNVTLMSGMFFGALEFNQDLSSWVFNSGANVVNLVQNTNIDTYNYDALLSRFVDLQYQNKNLGITNLEYCDAFSRAVLMNRGWSITSDSLAQNCAAQTLNGLFSYDIDSNGCDINDPKALNVHLNISNTETSIDVIAIDGEYSANLRPGTYTITPIIDNQHFNISPINASVTINQTGIITQDFCITDLGMFNDLEVVLFPIGDSRPGFDANYKLVYRNKGTSVLSGTINTQFENDYMTFLNASPAVTSTSLGVLNWNYSNIQPFETREILINFNLNTPTDPNFPLQLDDLLVFRSDINYNGTDATPYDNTFITRQKVVNSYDPNDKTCLQGETILPNEVGEFVHYRIRFENEGTASAANVKIIDYIDTAMYDVSTLTPLSSSHDYTTTIFDGNKVEFQFDNINLAFTAPASLGYVLFKIKTLDTLVLGDDFSNQAEIYFDFNAPIITNLETTAVAVPASITDRDLFQLQLVPNPANSLVTISSKINFQHITIYNTSGQVVFNNSFSSSILSHTLELENLPSGLYFVEISNTDHKALKKLLKQ